MNMKRSVAWWKGNGDGNVGVLGSGGGKQGKRKNRGCKHPELEGRLVFEWSAGTGKMRVRR